MVCCFLILPGLFAQVPQAFKYEFLLRTYNGNIATNTPVNLRISILDGSANGSIVYSETHSATTDGFGMLSLEVGNGTGKSGSFDEIEWVKGEFYLKMDELGGKNFMLMPTQKLLSVPYAFYAQRATNVDDADPDPTNEVQRISLSNDTLYLSDGGWVDLGRADNQILEFNEGLLSIEDGNAVLLPLTFSDTSSMNEIQQMMRAGDVITLSKGGGSFVDQDTRYSAGQGISIVDTVISNTAPSRWSMNGNFLAYGGEGAMVGTGNSEPSAILQANSNNKGFLPPRMTTMERNVILNPATGLMVFNTETSCLNFYNGSNWIEICGSCTPQPTAANAGPDQPDVAGTSASLGANTPQVGDGQWTIVQGEGGSFQNSADPKTIFTGRAGELYTLEWSITNECGTSRDQVIISFWSCGFPLTDLRDGQSYKTLTIGNRCWLGENMNYGIMVNASVDQTDNGTIEKYCYDDNATNCDKYGGLYQWSEAVQYATAEKPRGVCPEGWHVPSDSEWNELLINMGIDQANAFKTGLRGVDQGTRLKTGGASGFDALLGGSRLNNGLYYAINNYGNFWSSTSEGDKAWRHAVSGNTTGVFRTLNDRKEGLSVRCVKD